MAESSTRRVDERYDEVKILPPLGYLVNKRAYLLSGAATFLVYCCLVLAGLSLVDAVWGLGAAFLAFLLLAGAAERLLWGPRRRLATLDLLVDRHTAFLACRDAVQVLGATDPADVAVDSRIVVTTRPTWRSPGEVVTIHLIADAPVVTVVKIVSRSRYVIPIVEWGKNVSNVRRIAANLRQRELAS